MRDLAQERRRSADLLISLNKATKFIAKIFIQYGVAVGLWTKTLKLWQEAEERIAQYDDIQDQVHASMELAKPVPVWADEGAVFEIRPSDFGYHSWSEKTPDSGFFENYTVQNHLLDSSSVQSDTLGARFPDFLMSGGPDVPSMRGLIEVLYGGLRYGFPVGKLAAEGHQVWMTRFVSYVAKVYQFYRDVSLIRWPLPEKQMTESSVALAPDVTLQR